MTDRTLSAWRVSSLLVSTSCGIGFLLGTGEFALRQGMAASLYAVATAIGLMALAITAPRLWKRGQSIWTYFEALYGPNVSHQVAALSLIWMAGVLSAQIRGASSILVLLGMPRTVSITIVDFLVVALSLARLSQLSGLFALCMFTCNAMLVYVLIKTHDLSALLHAPVDFTESLRRLPDHHAGLTVLSVVALVLSGADYQQFPIAARTPANARLGCVMAAIVVLAVGFLPASAVIAGAGLWPLGHLPDQVQVVPRLLIQALGNFSPIVPTTVISLLVITALGSACSILRAMSDATANVSCSPHIPPVFYRVLPICAATLLTIGGKGLIDTMVTLNIVYLAAIGPLLGLTLLAQPISARAAKQSICTGFFVAAACNAMEWTQAIRIPESVTLGLAWSCALIVALFPYHSKKPLLESCEGIESTINRAITRRDRPRRFQAPHDQVFESGPAVHDGSQDH